MPNANPALCQVGGQSGLQSICPILWAGSPTLLKPQVLRNCLVEEDTCSAHKGSLLLGMYTFFCPHRPPKTPNLTSLGEQAR